MAIPSSDFLHKVRAVSGDLGFSPAYLMAIMDFETGGTFDPSLRNPSANSTATGLIQIIESTAQGLGTTTDELAQMSAIEQMDYVQAFFEDVIGRKGPVTSLSDVYAAVHDEDLIGMPDDTVAYRSNTREYEANPGMDQEGKGFVTKADLVRRIFEKLPRWEAVMGEAPDDAYEWPEPLRDWRDLKRFAEAHGFYVTSWTRGPHNTNSPHYTGHAIDIRTHGVGPSGSRKDGPQLFSNHEIDAFKAKCDSLGLKVRDERVRPVGQRVWTAPHLHIEIPKSRRGTDARSGGAYGEYGGYGSTSNRWARASDNLVTIPDHDREYTLDLDLDKEPHELAMATTEQLIRLDVKDGDEAASLKDIRPPEEGEMDIGDLRFGSVLNRELHDSHLNQVTSITQQNAGSVGVVEMIRTDTNPVIGDNRVLPEVVATISLNATTRDDVNRVLRPLVAQQKRMPFTVVRNAEVARLMLGVGVLTDYKDRLRQLYPEADEAEIHELAKIYTREGPSNMWVPVTLRDITVQTQPGAPDLFQVHVVMQYANTLAYVPRVQFWERTEDALKWAEYAGYRAQHGATVDRLGEDGFAALLGFDKRTVDANVPALAPQVDSPYRSHVFKKFYRGLLDEYQGEATAGTYRDRGIDAPPIGWTSEQAVITKKNQYSEVRAPAYPISQPSRLFEEYDHQAEMGLQFIYLDSTDTRDGRMSDVLDAFRERTELANALDAVANLYSRIAEGGIGRDFDGMKELGKVSPFVLGLSRSFGRIAGALGATGDEISRVADRYIDDARGRDGSLPDRVKLMVAEAQGLGSSYYDIEYNEGTRAKQLWENTFQGQDLTGFAVPYIDKRGETHEDLFVPFSSTLSHLQWAVLRQYTDTIHSLEQSAPTWWVELVERETASIPEAFKASYLISYDFLGVLIQNEQFKEHPAYAKVVDLIIASQEVVKSIADIVESEQTRIQSTYSRSAQRSTTYFDLSGTAVREGMTMRFSNRFADRPWDGYPQPVTQHIGGNGAEVTLQFTTNDKLLLDQLGQMKQAQMALGEMRKGRDVVPPLIDVYGVGNTLRAFGIKRLAYRAHTITVMENNPGYFRIKLDLIQDENTLLDAERWSWSGGVGADFLNAEPVRPLLMPGILWNADSGQHGYPASAAGVFLPVQPQLISDDDASWDQEGLLDASYYLDYTDTGVIPRRCITARVSYRTPEQRGGTSNWDQRFNSEIQYRMEESTGLSSGSITVDATARVSALLAPLGHFMDQAYESIENEIARDYMVSRINALLSGPSGWVAALNNFALSSVRTRSMPRSEFQGFESDGLSRGPSPRRFPEGSDEQATRVQDNITKQVNDIFRGEDVDILTAMAATNLRRVGNSIFHVLVANDETREAYFQWLLGNAQTVPLEGQDDGTASLTPIGVDLSAFDMSGVRAKATTAAAQYLGEGQVLPSCYSDLMLPGIRDSIQGINILGYDFPFGPGVPNLAEDRYLDDYKFVEEVRHVAMMEMATVGMDVLEDHLVESESSATAKESHRVTIDQYAEAFNATVEHIRERVRKRPGQDFPFDARGEGDYFATLTDELKRKGAFSIDPSLRLTKRDWVNILRITYSIKYTAKLIEVARGAVADQGGINSSVTALLETLEEQSAKATFGNLDVGDTIDLLSNIREVGADADLARDREQLIGLWAADPDTIAGQVGFYDSTAEPDRQKLQAKLKERWKGWQGMRRAFPTYQLLVVGRVGSSYWRQVSEQYSWSAVQSIEIRKQADSAGQSCDLVLSNMRQRIVLDAAGRRVTLLDGQGNDDQDLQLKIEPGTHMHVYTGYGPDITGLVAFAGRVTAIQPGPVTGIELSSYSTTLNNPPNDGKGFMVTGWEGHASISQAILYTLSKTSGLEGLGRHDITGALDLLGRSDRSIADGDEYRTSLALWAYNLFGSPWLGKFASGRSDQEDLQALVDAVGRPGGLTDFQNRFIGDSRLYENINVITGRARYGASNLFLGGFAHWRTNGKGWGWAALPGETTWAQLKDQSLLFPDYIVTTRPYNAGLALRDLARHPMRQTLYFGPKHGQYISTSDPGSTGGLFARLEKEDALGLLGQAHVSLSEIETVEDTERAITGGYDFAEEVYRDIFYKRFLVPLVIRQIYEGGENILDAWSSWIARTGNAVANIPFLSNVFDSFDLDLLRGHTFTQDQAEAIWSAMTAAFPNLSNAASTSLVEAREETDDISIAARALTVFNLFLSGGTTLFFGADLSESLTEELGYEASQAQMFMKSFELAWVEENLGPDVKRAMLAGFAQDLIALANDASVYQNVSGEGSPYDTDNAVLAYVRERLYERGYAPEQEYKPIVEHHFGNMYTSICNNDIIVGTQDPDFANRIQLQWPKDPDERLSAFSGRHGSTYQYSIQANPLISEDFIQEKVTYYPNLRYLWYEEAGLWSTMMRLLGDSTGEDSAESINQRRQQLQQYLEHTEQQVALVSSAVETEGRVLWDDGESAVVFQNFSELEADQYWLSGEELEAKLEELRQTAEHLQDQLDRVDVEPIDAANFQAAMEAYSNIRTAYEDGRDTVQFDPETYNIEGDDGWEWWDSNPYFDTQADAARRVNTVELLNFLERRVANYLQKMTGSIHLKPKFQTVAGNMLRESMRHMYGGTLTMAGDPRIEPYHIVHVWDDSKGMHGPVEVDGVYHSFSTEGYYTVIQPKLVSSLRGIDPTMDVVYMDYAAYYNSWVTALSRMGSSITGAALFTGRAAMWIYGSKFVAGILKKGVIGGPVGVGLAIADAVWTVGNFLYEGSVSEANRFVGIMAEMSDANPLVMLPMTYKAKPYMAGLTGATGPATIRQVFTERLDESRRGGALIDEGVFNAIEEYLGRGIGVTTGG